MCSMEEGTARGHLKVVLWRWGAEQNRQYPETAYYRKPPMLFLKCYAETRAQTQST